jgi:hypothetical protein
LGRFSLELHEIGGNHGVLVGSVCLTRPIKSPRLLNSAPTVLMNSSVQGQVPQNPGPSPPKEGVDVLAAQHYQVDGFHGGAGGFHDNFDLDS